MEYNNLTYVILPVSEITDENSTIDFSQLLNVSASVLRKNNDNSKAIVKYRGTQPSFLNSKTTYTHSQILNIVNDTEGEWYTEIEIE
tara:strand:+ start:213 stop:473 length:261 start_codon:yes stop_codon:yes gene_type:complete